MRASALKYAILTCMASIAILILVCMPMYGFLTVWFASAIGNYTAIRLIVEVLLLLSLIGLLYLLLTDQKIRGHTLTRRLVWLILVFSLLNFVCGMVAYAKHDVSLKALGYGLIVDLRMTAFFLVTWSIAVRTNRIRSPWLRMVLWPAAIVTAFGLLQVFVLPHTFLSHFGYGPNTIPVLETINHNTHYIRIQSTLRGANPLGAYLIIPISLLTVVIVRGKRSWPYLLLYCGLLVTLYYTFSRSAWVGAILSVGVILWLSMHSRQQRKWVLYATCLLVAVGGGFGVLFRHNVHLQNIIYHTQTHSIVKTTSDGGHASALESGFHDLLHEPLGRGPGSAGPASVYNDHPARIAENFYIQIGQETGWLGLSFFLLINIGVGYLLWLRRSDPLALGLFACLIGLTFVNMLSHAWADDTLAYVWWGLAGIAMAPFDKEKIKAEHAKTKS